MLMRVINVRWASKLRLIDILNSVEFLRIVPNAEGVAMADEFFSHSYLPWFGCTTFIRSNWINYVSFTALPLARAFRRSLDLGPIEISFCPVTLE